MAIQKDFVSKSSHLRINITINHVSSLQLQQIAFKATNSLHDIKELMQLQQTPRS